MASIERLYELYRRFPNVQTDTRKLQPGDLFFALKGPNFNGNTFVQKALEAGAGACVIDEKEYVVEGKTFLVDDALEALQELARHHRSRFEIPFLAITGSNGKTTTKELIHAVLSAHYRTYTTEGNLNNHIGVPLTLLKIRDDAEYAVIEMGANHQKEIASYCRVALPTHGLITNCGKAHLEGFGGEEGVRKGKGELFDHLRATGGTAFVMWDYGYLRDMSKGIVELVTYGTADAGIEGVAVQSDPFLEVAFHKGFEGTVRTQLVGSYNLPNVLAAVAVGTHFGVPPEKIRAALEAYHPSNSRSQLVQKGSNRIILDAYNANPSSMKLAVENFARTAGDDKVLVLGAMAELGTESQKEHAALAGLIGNYSWKEVLLVGGDFQKIDHPYRRFNSATEAGEWLRAQSLQGTSLLVKGSRSTGMEKVLDYL
ncbi:UDP-N-acetylmuramoyl-tripeptide--D-alanyl-D-alanine ligase [Flaviaesturariibacter flavus]|uniref:UDP-N-acetylmuramoyl-tripeptide--D-alanyl-D-alanine ligase n=1 Tax=Flaviaesturariibacter flavus TaxID=2502780 RepID=A0A4R1B599_9BACT|nr:UDP-N-acetylmuramoyl-tripeptide--D-alanyl-D-alanine ligase [Flaviaesturariibacter flavus]TCJ13302.1 UDP-N-acetylmuramoyl-tripeptide--D-alanyl-D-alanine ligase [Flaviaesturariibacter flavus]